MDDSLTLNRRLDDATSDAVTERGGEQEKFIIDGDSTASELWTLINTAVVAFEVLKSGNAGVGGSTGAVLHRSLLSARSLVARWPRPL
jgi:hypothetical protein